MSKSFKNFPAKKQDWMITNLKVRLAAEAQI